MGSYRLAWATKVTHSYYNTRALSFIPQLSIYRPLLLDCVSGASKLVTDGPYYQYLKGNRRYYTKWDNLSYHLTEVSSKPHQRYAPAGDGEVNIRWYRERGYDGSHNNLKSPVSRVLYTGYYTISFAACLTRAGESAHRISQHIIFLFLHLTTAILVSMAFSLDFERRTEHWVREVTILTLSSTKEEISYSEGSIGSSIYQLMFGCS